MLSSKKNVVAEKRYLELNVIDNYFLLLVSVVSCIRAGNEVGNKRIKRLFFLVCSNMILEIV